jgi:hypothetical protein
VDASLFIIRSVETARPESTVVAASEKMEWDILKQRCNA